ncbi:MAG: glycoside hydrolase family 127 protein, partial [Planctomycetota bacterium]|nr:glycoside hydrolase family 127 protein [Planctomycetota bacterium]
MSTESQKASRLRAVPFTAVSVADDFWTPRLETNRSVTIPFALAKCEETGRIDNFAKAGRLMRGEFRGLYYDDSDVFKVIEGAAYSLASHPDPALERYLDEVIGKIAAAQEPDGYLYTNRTIDPAKTQPQAGPQRWSNLKASHELYNVGHLYEAAVAHFHATGKRSLLDVALKNSELIAATFGPHARNDPPGHQEIEIGLARLYGVTNDRRYLELARFFLDQRGQAHGGRTLYGTYAQDHKPVTEQDEVVGHAVRALYMYCGMADVAALTGDPSYRAPLDTLWRDMVGRKLAITGGVGARKEGE